MSVKTVPWLPDGTLTNPERNTISAKTEKAVTGKHKIKGTYYYFNQNGTVTHTGLNYSLSSDCALLMNADTGQIIYGKMKMLLMPTPAQPRL